MQNFLRETLDFLKECDKTEEDVLYVSNGTTYCTWQDFVKQAELVGDYDDGFGSQEICPHLTIEGTNWFMQRHEYDGSENWEFYGERIKPENYNPSFEFTRNHKTLNKYW